MLRFTLPSLLIATSLFAQDPSTEPGKEELSAQQLPLTKKLYELVIKKETEQKSYEETVPRADNATLKMLAIPEGTFTLGSPESEEGRRDNEGPQKEVAISGFWMSETEIPWKLYRPFYENDPDGSKPRNKDGTIDYDGDRYTTDAPKLDGDLVDAVSQPTTQYHDMFVAGQFNNGENYPAMDMTHMAATKFCQWLTAQTGHFYRLPTEAEWEYACRAGTTTPYSIPADANLDDYAWHMDNSDFVYHPIKQKKPNPWGLYDMHGNVAEWVLDGYDATFYASLEDGVQDPVNWPTTRYPRVVRGGSWDNLSSELRSAARLFSKPMWKTQDPQIPKSVWYHTNGQHVGFRVVRPFKTPTLEEMHRAWNNDFRAPEFNAEDL
ncbi:MAG: formylglycine-generating enzyme family protein [Verrucomicrobiota bacterium JB023]|nr:formylglycine-generating enzyme family protein [Verrucomicrobiota bacterium JB023]